MIQPLLVLSCPHWFQGNLEATLSHAIQWRQHLNAYSIESALEIPVRRAEQEGWISDNPAIEDIDRLIQQAKEASCRLASIRIPISLNQPDKNLGNEISAINGWADLASYSDIPLVRFALLNTEFLSKTFTQNLLANTLSYMTEMEISVSLCGVEGTSSALSSLINQLDNKTEPHWGLETHFDCSPDRFEKPFPISSIPQTVSVPISGEFSQIPTLYDQIRSFYGDSLQAIVFEIQ